MPAVRESDAEIVSSGPASPAAGPGAVPAPGADGLLSGGPVLMPSGLVTIRRATELTGVSRRTIYNWINANRLQIVRTAGGSVRIDAASLFRRAS